MKRYEEEQAEWVKKYDVKVGDKVKILRGWSSGEKNFKIDMSQARTSIGMIGVIEDIFPDVICVVLGLSDMFFYPYFVLELKKGKKRECANKIVVQEKRVVFDDDTGFIYSGNTCDDMTVDEWLKKSNKCRKRANRLKRMIESGELN